MSKARRKAIEQVRAAMLKEDGEPPVDAICTLLEDFLGNVERIADAVEKPMAFAAGAGTVVGELAKWEPLITPEQIERGLKALEVLAAASPPQSKT